MDLLNKVNLTVKKSKFIAYYYQVNDPSEVKEIIRQLKKEHPQAKHFPFAYQISSIVKKNDNKEPSLTAGLPILDVIIKHHLENRLIIVVRYFGGIKLGLGGLIRAYRQVAIDVIKKS